MKFLILLLVLLAFVWQAESKCERKASYRPIQTYEIDLDKPPEDRFNEPTRDYSPQLFDWLESEKKRLHINDYLVQLIEILVGDLDKYFPYPFSAELRGISEAVNSTIDQRMTIGDVVLANLIYDLTAYCTSTIVRQQNGQIIHGRNLDYDFPADLMNLTYIAHFYRNGKLLFKSAQIVGYLGIVTGHRYKSFTFSINERDQGALLLNLIFAILDWKSTPFAFLSRRLMENVTNYDDAVHLLQKQHLIAPAYFIVGGILPDEGAIITRNQYKTIDTLRLNVNETAWFIVQTNDDNWLPPLDDRRNATKQALNKIGQDRINYDTMLDVLSLTPICNNDTVYSVVMSAVDNTDNGFQIIVH